MIINAMSFIAGAVVAVTVPKVFAFVAKQVAWLKARVGK